MAAVPRTTALRSAPGERRPRGQQGRSGPGAAQPAGGNGRVLPLETLARDALRTGGPLVGQASLTARGAGPAFAAHLVDVRVDPPIPGRST